MNGYRRRRIGVGGFAVIALAFAVVLVIAARAWAVIVLIALVYVALEWREHRKEKGQVPDADND